MNQNESPNEPPVLGATEELPTGWAWRSYHALKAAQGIIYEVEVIQFDESNRPTGKRICKGGLSWSEARKNAAEAAKMKGGF